MEKAVKEISTVKIPALAIKDKGAVRMGYMTPAFPPVRAAPTPVADEGKVRMGYMTPAFPPAPRH